MTKKSNFFNNAIAFFYDALYNEEQETIINMNMQVFDLEERNDEENKKKLDSSSVCAYSSTFYNTCVCSEGKRGEYFKSKHREHFDRCISERQWRAYNH